MNIKSLILIIFISSRLFGQAVPVGLDGKVISSLAVDEKGYPERVIIAGVDSGIYYQNFNDSDTAWIQPWIHHYFYGNKVSSIYIQHIGSGPADLSKIFASVAGGDSAGNNSVYTNNYPVQSFWAEMDSGIDKTEPNEKMSFAGFDYSGHEPPAPVFCSTRSSIYILRNGIWEKVWNNVMAGFEQLFANDSTVYAAGTIYGWGPAGFILKSKNYGVDWETYNPGGGWLDYCYSIVTPPNNSDTIYVGLNGVIAKTVDGGTSWTNLSLNAGNFIIKSLVINPLNHKQIFAGGKSNSDEFILYKTSNGGAYWKQIFPQTGSRCKCGSNQTAEAVYGINSMAGTIVNGKFILYIGTNGRGVFKYSDNGVSTENNFPDVPGQYQLLQNYPNPFNPTTNFEFQIPSASGAGLVVIKVYDVLGNEVATLMNEEKEAGNYKVTFDASGLPSGVYFYKLEAGNFTKTKKMVLIR